MNKRLIRTPKPLGAALLFIAVAAILLQSCAPAQDNQPTWPQPQNYVSDFADVVPEQSEQQINSLAQSLENTTGDELAVVTTQSYQNKGYASIEEAAVELFEQWGIGQQDQDNGLLVLAAMDEREWRIEVGYGLEGVIPDAIADQMGRQYLRPHFRQNNYGNGLLSLTVAIIQRISEQKEIPLNQFEGLQEAAQQPSTTNQSPSRPQQQSGGLFNIIFNVIIGVVMIAFFIHNPKLFLLFMLMGGMRGGWGGGSQFGGGIGNRGGGMGGGGFGGFGGGMSGGGGASGGW